MIQFWLLGVIAVVIIVRRFSRIGGAALGALAAVGIGAWGTLSFRAGHALAFAGVPITLPIFLGIIGVWLAFELWGLWGALRNRGTGDDS